MALKPLQAGVQPLGQFDGVDAEISTFLGGEVCYLSKITYPGTDKGAADVSDGYSPAGSTPTRVAVSHALTSGVRPLFLADEGTSGYGTLFGQVVGATVGQVVTGGTALGPHTAVGSGKITLWDKVGLYAVTLDAADTTHNTGLVPQNVTLDAGDPLYATATGKLTPLVGAAFESYVVGRFIEFQTDGSLVTTPRTLVSALNSPTGGVAGAIPFTQAVFHFNPGE